MARAEVRISNAGRAARKLLFAAFGRKNLMFVRQVYLQNRVVRNKINVEREHDLLRFLISSGDVVMDIGANIGLYTKALSELVRSSGKVLAFEPMSENIQILKAIVRRAAFPNITLFEQAVGARTGEQLLTIPDHGGFSSLYLATLSTPFEPSSTQYERMVQTISLDHICVSQKLTHLEFVKCDVEGAETEVISGGIDSLKKFRPAILIELAPNTSECVFEALTNICYEGFVYRADRQLLEKTSRFLDGQSSNYLFFHPESVAWKRARKLINTDRK